MASGAFTRGLQDWLNGTTDFLTATLKWLLLATATPYTYDPDTAFLDQGGANDIVDAELNVSGYVRGWGGSGRKVLTGKTITVDDTNNRLVFDAADPTWTALGAGQTIAAAVCAKEGASADTTSRPHVYLDPADLPTNGSDVTLQLSAQGLVYFQIV